jgi:hypothetical protein
MSNELKKEFEFYLANQEEMVKKYDGKVIVLKDGEVLGAYDSELAAVIETQKSHSLGTFLVQRVSEGDEAYTQTFHSRVGFS